MARACAPVKLVVYSWLGLHHFRITFSEDVLPCVVCVYVKFTNRVLLCGRRKKNSSSSEVATVDGRPPRLLYKYDMQRR